MRYNREIRRKIRRPGVFSQFLIREAAQAGRSLAAAHDHYLVASVDAYERPTLPQGRPLPQPID